MKVTLEKLPASQVGFEIEVEGQKSQAIYDRAVQKLVKTAEIPGFRKGKAPKQLILQQFGKTQLKASVLEDLIEETLTQALKDHLEQVKAIGQFQMRSPLEEVVANFEIGKPLTFKAAIDVEPEVTLKKYQGFEVKAERIEPKLETVDQMLHDFQVRRATLIPVEDRPAQTDDVVTVDYTFIDTETDLPIPDQAVDGETFSLDQESEGDANIVPAIAGMSIGETKQIPAYLDPEYWDEPMGGRSVIYNVTLKEIKARELPALDDEFAQAISEKQTMVELREFLDQREIDTATSQTKFNVDSALLDALSAEVEVDIPESLIDEETNFLIRQQLSYLSRQPGMQKIVDQLFNKENLPTIVEATRPEAISRVKRSLAVAELAEQVKIEATEAEVAERAESVLKELEDTKNIDRDKMLTMLTQDIVSEKALEWLTQNCTIEYVPEGSLKVEAPLDQEDSLTVESETVQELLNPAEEAIDVQTEVITDPEIGAGAEPQAAQEPTVESDQPETKAKSKKAKK